MLAERIIFWVLLADSLSCNLIVLFGNRWYARHFRTISRLFPATEGWAVYYLVLVLWIGALLYR